MVLNYEHLSSAEPKAKIFISYSRKDMAFADRLEAALKARGFEPLIDRNEIFAFEDWWKRIQGLISRADTVVFVLSADSVKSDVALKEVAHAASLNKRFAPIVYRQVDDTAVPEALGRLNFIFFDDPARFEANADHLAAALQIDIDWVRRHTEYGESGRRWAAMGRPTGLLLRSPALEEAERWMSSRPRNAPVPTAETQAFVAQSRREAIKRRWRAQALAAVSVAVMVMGLVAWWNQNWLKERIYVLVHVAVLAPGMERALKPGDKFKECRDCPEMVVVPPGQFIMGSSLDEKGREDGEGPQHKVSITRRFAVSRFEATFDQWDACVTYGGCLPITVTGEKRDKWPVFNVSWFEVKQYVSWLSRITGKDYRLLSEAEWEYAERAGTTTRYSFGDDEAALGQYAWYLDNSGNQIHPIGEKLPNAFQLYDMQGNVWEWVEDTWHPDYTGNPPTDGSEWKGGDTSLRDFRGGSWLSAASSLRSATRNKLQPFLHNLNIGFRVARSVSQPDR